MADNYVIEMLHITKEFPGIKANDDITLQLRKGEIHALLGENGAGKSTLMSVLFGLYQPEQGTIRKNGQEVKINNPNEVLKVGDEVDAVILDIDPQQQRISLGLKQTEDDPWANIETLYKIGDVVKGKVTKITAFGAFIELSHKIDGLVHISQISKDRVEKVKDKLALGQEIEARVIKIDKEERRIGLSIKALEEGYTEDDLKAAGEEVSAALKPGAALVDMGKVIGDALDDLDVSENN